MKYLLTEDAVARHHSQVSVPSYKASSSSFQAYFYSEKWWSWGTGKLTATQIVYFEMMGNQP